MAGELTQGLPLVNIVLAEVITEDTVPETWYFDTAQEANIDPNLSEGEENVLRIKNKILATNRTEDIVVGYDTTLSANTLLPELFAIVDGGKLVYDSVDTDKVVSYDAPLAGIPVKRKSFTLNLYTEEKDIDGETLQYVKFGFKNCKGRPVAFSLEDGEFFVPEMIIRSRPKACEKPIEIEFLDELPEYTEADICAP